MKKRIILTEKERTLIECLRNLKKSRHNYSTALEIYVRDLFDIMIDEIKN